MDDGRGVGGSTRPPLGTRANDSMARSMSAAFSTRLGTSSIASEGATASAACRKKSNGFVLGLATRATRAMRGAISLSIASHLPVMLSSYSSKPVRFPPGRARLATKPEPMGRHCRRTRLGSYGSPVAAQRRRSPLCENHVGLQGDQLFREHLRLSAGGRKPSVDSDIAVLRPSKSFEALPESRNPRFDFRIVLGEGHQHADPLHPRGLLRPRHERPRRRCPAEHGDEIASPHAPAPSGQGRTLSHCPRLLQHSKTGRRLAAVGHKRERRPRRRPASHKPGVPQGADPCRAAGWGPPCANAPNRCAIARGAGSPTASAATGGEIVDSMRAILS